MDTLTTQQEQAQIYFRLIHEQVEKHVPQNKFLCIGKLGLVLYYFSLYEAMGNEAYANRCIELLQEVLDEEDGTPPLYGTGFASGTAGLGYILAVVQKNGLLEIDMQEEFAAMDKEIAATALKQVQEDDHIDYLHGAMGAVHYFLQRTDEPQIRQYLEQLGTAICNRAVKTDKGYWFRNYIVDKAEKERIDLGLSHGNSGFLLLLLQMQESGIKVPLAEEHIKEGIRFILGSRFESSKAENGFSLFPFYINSIDQGLVYANARLAWCYGDLDIAWLLYRAASVLKMPGWKTIADEIVSSTLNRKDAASTLTEDSHFCHGTSGLAFFYKRIYDYSAEESHKAASEYWTGETLRYLDTELKNGHYQNRETDLLNGLPGINLVLLSLFTNKELAWGRAFLL